MKERRRRTVYLFQIAGRRVSFCSSETEFALQSIKSAEKEQIGRTQGTRRSAQHRSAGCFNH